jgi:hypothetical protein
MSTRHGESNATTAVWNWIVPVLGIALIAGAPMLWAIAVAAVAALVIHAVLRPSAGVASPHGILHRT